MPASNAREAAQTKYEVPAVWYRYRSGVVEWSLPRFRVDTNA